MEREIKDQGWIPTDSVDHANPNDGTRPEQTTVGHRTPESIHPPSERIKDEPANGSGDAADQPHQGEK